MWPSGVIDLVNIGAGNGLLSEATKPLTHWGQVTHTCIGNLTIIGSDNQWLVA